MDSYFLHTNQAFLPEAMYFGVVAESFSQSYSCTGLYFDWMEHKNFDTSGLYFKRSI